VLYIAAKSRAFARFPSAGPRSVCDRPDTAPESEICRNKPASVGRRRVDPTITGAAAAARSAAGFSWIAARRRHSDRRPWPASFSPRLASQYSPAPSISDSGFPVPPPPGAACLARSAPPQAAVRTKHRSGASMPAKRPVPRAAEIALGTGQLGRVGDFVASPAASQHANLVGRSESVLYGAQKSGNWLRAFALERQHRHRHVLDPRWPAIWPSLVTCPNQDDRSSPTSWRRESSPAADARTGSPCPARIPPFGHMSGIESITISRGKKKKKPRLPTRRYNVSTEVSASNCTGASARPEPLGSVSLTGQPPLFAENVDGAMAAEG